MVENFKPAVVEFTEGDYSKYRKRRDFMSFVDYASNGTVDLFATPSYKVIAFRKKQDYGENGDNEEGALFKIDFLKEVDLLYSGAKNK